MDKYDCIIELENDIEQLNKDQMDMEDVQILHSLVERIDTSSCAEEIRSIYSYTKLAIKQIYEKQQRSK